MSTTIPQLIEMPASIPGGAQYQHFAYVDAYDAVLNCDFAFVAYKETDSFGWRVRIKSSQTAGAVFEPDAMRSNARSTSAQGKPWFLLPTPMKLILPISAMICTVLATVTALVFCMAAGANSTDDQYRALKLWMSGISLLGVAVIVAGIFLTRAGQHGWAAVVAIAPTIIYGIVLFVTLLKMILK